MHKLLIALTLILAATNSSAADKPVRAEKSIVCYPIKQFLKDIRTKYGEEAMIIGEEGTMEEVGMAVYINKENGSYTVIEFDKEAACVISVGKNVRYRFPKLGLAS